MALSSEFVSLVQQEIPDGRQSLNDSHANLDKVAAYCIENFMRVGAAAVQICAFFAVKNVYFNVKNVYFHGEQMVA